MTTTTEPVYWDPYNHAQRVSPYETWRRMRDEAPVYHNERYGFYAISRFEDVLACSLDTETFSSASGITLDGIPIEPPLPMMIMMDPPKHDVMRKVVNRAYTPRRVAALEARIRELCAQYLDPFVGTSGFDFVVDFGMRLPVMVISSLLGFPEEDHDMLREWSDGTLHREEGQDGFTDEAMEMMAQAHMYYLGIVQQRRADPQDDMISELIGAEFEDLDGTHRHLDDMEVLGMISLISNAGNETVARLLGWSAVVLADFPDQRALFASDPATYAAPTVEEMLRFEAPSPIQGRYTEREITLHGVTIPEHSITALLTGSAGRDERQYPDADRFDIRRKAERHVSLGYGAHFCLGAALARLEGRVALTEAITRFPEWDIDRDAIQMVATNTVRGPSSAPIRV